MTDNRFSIDAYQAQLEQKTQSLQAMMQPFNPPEIAVFSSPVRHYRMRAEFRIWHDGENLFHVMFDQHTKRPFRVDTFPAACLPINHLMPHLIHALQASPILRHKLFQIDYLCTQQGELLVSLLYHRALDEAWCTQAHQLREHLRAEGHQVDVIGRAAKTKILLDKDYVDECLQVAKQSLIYRQIENSFTQPNAAVNEKMLTWAQTVTQGIHGDLLELYCGNGNFTVALAQQFRRVLATEISKSSVLAAQHNCVVNQVNNVQIVRLSAEEISQAMQGTRSFRRLSHINLEEYQCDTLLVDPPRSGLDPHTLGLAQQFPRVLYISCNPTTLCENLACLSQHRITRLALFDQLPYTTHVETGVLLERT